MKIQLWATKEGHSRLLTNGPIPAELIGNITFSPDTEGRYLGCFVGRDIIDADGKFNTPDFLVWPGELVKVEVCHEYR